MSWVLSLGSQVPPIRWVPGLVSRIPPNVPGLGYHFSDMPFQKDFDQLCGLCSLKGIV